MEFYLYISTCVRTTDFTLMYHKHYVLQKHVLQICHLAKMENTYGTRAGVSLLSVTFFQALMFVQV